MSDDSDDSHVDPPEESQRNKNLERSGIQQSPSTSTRRSTSSNVSDNPARTDSPGRQVDGSPMQDGNLSQDPDQQPPSSVQILGPRSYDSATHVLHVFTPGHQVDVAAVQDGNLSQDPNQQSPNPLLMFGQPQVKILMVHPVLITATGHLFVDDMIQSEDLLSYAKRPNNPNRSVAVPYGCSFSLEFICLVMPSQHLLWRLLYHVPQPAGSPTAYRVWDDPNHLMFLTKYGFVVSLPPIKPRLHWTLFALANDPTPQLRWMPDRIPVYTVIFWRPAPYASFSLPAFPGFPDFFPIKDGWKGLSICNLCDLFVYPNSMYNLIGHIAGHHKPFEQRYQCLMCPKATLLVLEMHWHLRKMHRSQRRAYYVDKGGDELWGTWRTVLSDCFPYQTVKFDECVDRWRGA